jgi:uncharacterized protein
MRLLDLADARFVSLTTFRTTGVPVSTPVWIARDGDDLIVTTPVGVGKLKRLRNNPLVELRECSRLGRIADDAPVVTAAASEEGETSRLLELFSRKYRLEYRIMLGVEKLVSKGNAHRVIIRISDR